MQKNLKISCPIKSEVEKYLKIWKKDDDLRETSENLIRLFTKIYPENNDFNNVWIKVQVLNSAFNTNVPEIHKVAWHIVGKEKNISVKAIRGGHGACRRSARNESDLYSFATKYCSFHNDNSDEYPIFDANVKRALEYFRENCNFKFEGSLRNYENFVAIVNKFNKHFHLDCSLRDIDKYLYLVGRELRQV